MTATRSILLLGLVCLLPACGSSTVKQTLGLNRAAPDEFRVVSRPPLSVPPQFNLRPPSATAEAPGQAPASSQAESLILGTPSTGTPIKAADKSDAAFLKNVGADKADPNIRSTLVEERMTQQDQDSGGGWWSKISTDPGKKDPMVNAKQESQRIQKNEEEGKPVTEGDTPVVKGRDTGVLGNIFGY